MKKLSLALFFVLFSNLSVFAGEHCYQVSTAKKAVSTATDTLCVDGPVDNRYQLTLRMNERGREAPLATFNLDLIKAARCFDCNEDLYGVNSPSNPSFSSLRIQFHGKGNRIKGEESGTVSIGNMSLYYYSK